ncbi:conserved hypothetical protein [Streptomyces scabiei 87.22]|uniref:Uncharacterized protein n=1 Tax=Streptomyces scabiei (strain 87.22) TaxID=680198 RepID=C9Z9N1_STRSW|nr:hypothetical protein IQ61_39290 [Streptomyces scabiei]CBG75959.1 conserved hypothetical protein [Streptomyces scabiei 87.22]
MPGNHEILSVLAQQGGVGSRHPLAFVLAQVAYAVPTGAKSLAAITGGIRRAADRAHLARRARARPAGPVAPAGTRMRRLLQRVDGKTVRGARRRDGTQVHLLAAMTAGRQVIARREVLPRCEVCHKTNETSLTAMRSELILSSI